MHGVADDPVANAAAADVGINCCVIDADDEGDGV